MSEDGLPDPLDDPPMEVTVETLTGTVFDIRVYPTETILDIKNKIQRVEGIPVHHQSILFQMKEMHDFDVLGDSGITNGCILKLVLSIRGGPISTRRFTSCDHHIIWRDLKELIENSQAEGNEPGSKVSVLVFKDGEVLNVLRVVENEDGSYSPYTDKADHAAAVSSSSTTTQADASKTQKGPEKTNSESTMVLASDNPPESVPDGVLTGGSTSCGTGGGVYLPPVPIHWSSHRPRREQIKEEMHQADAMFVKMAEDVEMANKLQHLKRKMRHMRAMRNAKHDPPITSEGVEDTMDMGMGESALKEKHRSRTHRPSSGYYQNLHVFDQFPTSGEQFEDEYVHPAQQRLQMTRLELIMQDQEQEIGLEEAHQQELAACTPSQCKIGGGMYPRRASLDYDNSDFGLGSMLDQAPDDPDDIFYRLPAIPRYAAHSHSHAPFQPPPPCVAARSPLYGRLSHNANDNYLSPLAQSPSPDLPERNSCNIERVQNDFIDYDDLEQDVFGYYNAEFDKYIASGIPPASSVVSGSSGLDLNSYYRSMEDISDEEEPEVAGLASEIKKLTLRSDFQVQAGDMQPMPIASCSTVGNSTICAKRELPAVMSKKRMRCGQCNKRLNITNIYNCRCGLIFCAQHRYSESHDCKYDYKAEGRKLIEQQNPLVTASKLTKF